MTNPAATAEELRSETERWREKLVERMEQVEPVDAEGEDLLENATAYVSDASHFEDQGDWVRAFESVIWAWSWIEIGERLGHIREGQ